MTDLDWSRPIEAVHPDGRLVSATHDKAMKASDGARWVYGDFGDMRTGSWFGENGTANHTRWRIRNVQPITPELDPALWDRMEALVRRIADVPKDSALGQSGYASEARAIVAELPKPVDPDLIEARKRAVDLLSKTVVSNGLPDQHPEIMRIREGCGDSNSYVVAILDALKRGRELSRQGDAA